jgi:S1-C subfamily serine protease
MAGIDRANGKDYDGDDDVEGREPVDAELRPRADKLDYDLAATCRAVFTLHSKVPSDAFTAQHLGEKREGNAILIDEDGLCLTIGYLITEATTVSLVDWAGEAKAAEVVGYDQASGYGLVRLLEDVDARPIPIGSVKDVHTGAAVTALAGGGPTFAMAVRLLSKREFAGYWEYLLDEALFTAPTHPHWSGAALISDEGKLIGLGSLYVQDVLPSENSPAGNMFVPIDMLSAIVEELAEAGQTVREPRPWMGMFVTDADGAIVIAGMVENGPAARSNLRLGDAVMGVAGEDVSDLPEFYRAVWARGPAGASVRLNILRDGRLRDIAIRTADRLSYLKRMPGSR